MNDLTIKIQQALDLIRRDRSLDRSLDAMNLLVIQLDSQRENSEWNQNLDLLQQFYSEVESKSGVTFDFIRNAIFRGMTLGLHVERISMEEMFNALKILNHASEKSVRQSISDLLTATLKSILQTQDWHQARLIVACAKIAGCFDGEFKTLVEDLQRTIAKIIGEISRAFPDHLCMFFYHGIGDILAALSLSYEMQRRIGKSRTCVILPERFESIGKMYDNIDAVVPLPKGILDQITFFCSTTGKYHGDNWVWGELVFDENPDKIKIVADCDIYDQYRSRFNLPMETPPNKFHLNPPENLPDIPNANRAIILFPRAMSFYIDECTPEFWKNLAMKLKALGFEIYTNLAPNEEPIDGTIPLRIDLQQLFFTAEKVRCCIGIRSGVFDLLGLSTARIIAVDINVLSRLETMFNRAGLKTIFWKHKEHPEFWTDEYNMIDSTEDLSREILESVKKEGF